MRGSQYPQIQPDQRVTFRFKAPEAKKVLVLIYGKGSGLGEAPIEMTRDDNGVWMVTSAPINPGFYYYELVIDGTKVNDPSSETFFGYAKPTSGLEVPDAKPDYYNLKDVPHGTVSARIRATGSQPVPQAIHEAAGNPHGHQSPPPVEPLRS